MPLVKDPLKILRRFLMTKRLRNELRRRKLLLARPHQVSRSAQPEKADQHQWQLTDLRRRLREARCHAGGYQAVERSHVSTMQGTGGVSLPIVVAVDLLPLLRGGENGGIKPAIFSLLGELARQAGGSLIFVFLTNSASHSEVQAIARPEDILICALEKPLHPAHGIEKDERCGEFKLIPPPLELLRSIEVDLLYCPFGMTPFHVSGIPTIALIADVLHRDYRFTLTEQQISERETYIAETIRVASKVQCISRSGIERLIANYNIDAAKLFYTYLPIHSRLEESSNRTENDVKGPLSRPFFFYPANLWIHKNHEILLLGYACYREQSATAAWDLLLTFQEEPRAAELQSLARALGISAYVRFEGFVSEQELHHIWQTAGALVFPSLHEGFGIPVVEAMHYGVPIISSTEFSLKEITGDACYPIDPRKPSSLANALLEMSTNAELREELVRRGRERVMLFDLKAAGKVLLNQFYSAIRTDEGFPRSSNRGDRTALLTLPTPASEEPWRIEIACDRTSSDQKLSVYLDDFPYGTFHQTNGKDAFSFICRPQGRILGVHRARNTHSDNASQADSSDHPVTRIVAQDLHGRRIILYEKSTTPLNA